MSHLSPAKEVVQKLGGVRALARVLEINPSAVSRWMMPSAKGGTNGLIPQRHWPAILKHAKEEKVKVKLDDLVAL
jgi:hypothetical protein